MRKDELIPVKSIQILEEMVESLVELMIEKDVITEEEFDAKFEERIKKFREGKGI